MTDITMIEAAAFRLAGHVRRTPLLCSPALDAIAGRRVLVKAECLQATGSFKARGGWAAISALEPADRARGVLAMSSGNHAQGVALAAQALGVAAVILMPADAPAVKIDATRAMGAEVVLYNRATTDRDALAHDMATTRGLIMIPPFDHPQVIAGQGTVGLELTEQLVEDGFRGPADVLVCCGGGGLSAGIAIALASRAPGLRVRTVEPAGFDDMARSLASGTRETNTAATGSLCDAILTPRPGALTFPILQAHCGPGIAVTDDQACTAVALAFRHLRVVLEPGGAVSLAAALLHPDAIEGDAVACIATGGNVDADLFTDILRRFG